MVGRGLDLVTRLMASATHLNLVVARPNLGILHSFFLCLLDKLTFVHTNLKKGEISIRFSVLVFTTDF